MTIDVVVQKKPRFGKKSWKEVACRENCLIEREPALDDMQERFGTEIGGYETADGSSQGWEFVMQDPADLGMSVMTTVTLRRTP